MFHFIRPSLTRWLGGMLVLLVLSFTYSNYKEVIDSQDAVQKSSNLPAMSNIVKQNYRHRVEVDEGFARERNTGDTR